MAVQRMAHGGIALVTTAAIFFLLASVMVVLRFIARKNSHNIGIDDWACLASYLLLIALTICHLMVGGPYGYAGAPQKDFSMLQLEHFEIVSSSLNASADLSHYK